MAKTTEEDGGGAELGMRTSSYSNAVTDDTAPPSAAGKPEHSMTFSSHPELKELDTVGDGTIDEVDLLRLLKLKHHEENIIREQRYGLLCLTVVIIGVGLGLGLELKNSKEATTDAIEEARLGVTQAHEVVVPTEFKVGTAVKFQVPGTDPDEPGTNPDEPASSFDLKTKMGNPIRPDRSLDKIKLTSELPDSAFAELERIQVEGVAGRINFKTQGFGRYSAPDSRCGSVVIVYTTMGSVQFDGTSMMFDEQVAGSFEKAGFQVSGARKRARRTKSARSRRTADMDENNYSLIGVNRMFGEFSFLGNVDLSSLSCGDERPSLKTPFDGHVYDIQTEEHGLFACGEGTTECPTTAPLIEGLKGETYFKRTTKMRAKKVDGVWRSIRATTFPDLNEDDATPAAQFRDGQFVEISNGDQGQTYQFWPNMMSADHNEMSADHNDTGPKFTRCEHNVSTGDKSQEIEANTTDIVETAYAMDFIGYDVLNNHYVKHFRVYDLDPNAGVSDVDYLESYTEDRMYSIQLIEGHWTTYESIKTNGDVDPNFLQGAAYPDIDANDFGDAASGPVQCFDNVLWNAIDEFANYTYDDILAFKQEREHAAEIPNLVGLLSKAWNFAAYEDNVQQQREIGDEMINTLFPNWNDDIIASESVSANDTDDGSGGGDDDGNDDERRSRSISDVDDTVADATGDGDNVLTPNVKTTAHSERETPETPPPQPAAQVERVQTHAMDKEGDEAHKKLVQKAAQRTRRGHVGRLAAAAAWRAANQEIKEWRTNPYWSGGGSGVWVYWTRPRGTRERCAACRAGAWTLDRRQDDGVMACFGFCSEGGYCGLDESYKNKGVDCSGGYEPGCDKCKDRYSWRPAGNIRLGYRQDGKKACSGKVLDFGKNGFSDGNGWCRADGHCWSTGSTATDIYCGAGGQPPKPYTITKSGFRNKWCNNDKIMATPVSTMWGTADECINECDTSPTCAWVGHRRSDGYCELWQVGSCKIAHGAYGHDIYNIKFGQQSGGSKALVRTKAKSGWSYAGDTVMNIVDISDSGASVGGQFDIGGEMKTIMAINVNVITFDPPLIANFAPGVTVDFAFGDNMNLQLQLDFENGKFPSQFCTTFEYKIMGPNPYLTFTAKSCASNSKPPTLYGTTPGFEEFFVELKLEMGGSRSFLWDKVSVTGMGSIRGVVGVKRNSEPPRQLQPYFLFEGQARIAIKLPQVETSLLVTATYEFIAAPPMHRITLQGLIEISPGCRRRRRRRGFADELHGVLLRDPRNWFSDVGNWAGQAVNDVGSALKAAGGAIASFAKDAVDFVKTLVCDNSISAGLTFYYEARNIALLKVSFPRTPVRVTLEVCVKFLGGMYNQCLPMDITLPTKKKP